MTKVNARNLLIVTLVSALGLLAVMAIARSAPSAEGNDTTSASLPLAKRTTAAACTEWATFWTLPDGHAMAIDVVANLQACKPGIDGQWFVPDDPFDARLAAALALTPAEEEELAGARIDLLAVIDRFEEEFSPALKQHLFYMYDPVKRPLLGHQREGYGGGSTAQRYYRLLKAYLVDPDNTELSRYVAWIMERRLEAGQAWILACDDHPANNPYVGLCRHAPEAFSYRQPPYPWTLTDSFLIDTYLVEQMRT